MSMPARVTQPPIVPALCLGDGPSAAEDGLWLRWRLNADAAARQELFQLHLPWARLVARDVYRRIRLRQLEWADYVHYATIGLLESVDRFDPSRGVAFRTFARHRVRGAVFNGLRGYRDAGVRSDDRARRLDARRDSLLEHSDGSEDALEELARVTIGMALGLMLEEQGLEETADGGTCSGYRAVDAAQTMRLLRELLATLPDRDRIVLELHYFQHLPFVEVAQLLGVTKGRVSQVHHRALKRLRDSWAQTARG